MQRLHGAALPKFWRPKVAPAEQLTCQIIHRDSITAFTQGTATFEVMGDWIETGLTQLTAPHKEFLKRSAQSQMGVCKH